MRFDSKEEVLLMEGGEVGRKLLCCCESTSIGVGR